jgi:hypothetical protein
MQIDDHSGDAKNLRIRLELASPLNGGFSRFGTNDARPKNRSSHFGIRTSNCHSRQELRSVHTNSDLHRVLPWKWRYAVRRKYGRSEYDQAVGYSSSARFEKLAPQFSASSIQVSLARRAVSAVQLPELNRQTPEVEHTVTRRKQTAAHCSNRQKIQKCLSRFWRTRSDCASSIGPRAVLTARNSGAKEKRNPASSNSAIIVAR